MGHQDPQTFVDQLVEATREAKDTINDVRGVIKEARTAIAEVEAATRDYQLLIAKTVDEAFVSHIDAALTDFRTLVNTRQQELGDKLKQGIDKLINLHLTGSTHGPLNIDLFAQGPEGVRPKGAKMRKGDVAIGALVTKGGGGGIKPTSRTGAAKKSGRKKKR